MSLGSHRAFLSVGGSLHLTVGPGPCCGLQATPPGRGDALGSMPATEQMLGLPVKRGRGWRKPTVQVGVAGTGAAV